MKHEHPLLVSVGLGISLALFGAGCSLPGPSQTAPQTAPTPASAIPSSTVNTKVQETVSISNFSFLPQSLVIKAGMLVTWTNNDTVSHTVTADDGTMNSGSIQPGSSFSHTFEKAGTVGYHCTIHPTMQGTISVQ